MTSYDVAVVGLGGLGSATAWQLARRESQYAAALPQPPRPSTMYS